MTISGPNVPLSLAKSKLSELIRTVRSTGEDLIITVDGEPVVRVSPIPAPALTLTAAEVATVRALLAALHRIPRPSEPFDSVALVSEGRR